MLIGFIAAVLLLVPSARADGLNWDIDSFDVEITVNEDGSFDVVETIVADFTREQHRGIFRSIPFRYRRTGTSFELRIDIDSVTDERDQRHPYTSWRDDGKLTIRIGDPKILRNERVTYRIAYTVRRGLLALDTHDELYWNVTGDEWGVPIEEASCVVRLPAPVEASSIRTTSFVGPHGSSSTGPEASVAPDGTITFSSGGPLRMREGLTAVVGFPKGLVEAPTASTRVGWFLRDNAVVLTPFIVFPLLYLFWRVRGRDHGTPGPIVVQYEPPDNLTPLEVGTIIDERVDTRDITASIVGLAVRGYIKIEIDEHAGEKPDSGDVTLVRLTESDAELEDFERRIMKGLFKSGDTVTMSDLKHEFYRELAKIRKETYDALDRKGYFIGNFGNRRGLWIVLGVLCAIGTVLLAVALSKRGVFAPVSVFIAAGLTAPMFIVFFALMPRKTAKGRRALERVKGLEEYLRRAAIDEIEVAARQNVFQKLLPYALALDLGDEWAKRFEGLFDQPPDWYDHRGLGTFSTIAFVHSLNHSTNTMGQTLASMPRSSGSGGFGSGSSGFSGGFSGGGGGGGGGGAW